MPKGDPVLDEDVRILFSGFEPSNDVRSRLDVLLDQLHLKAPSHSFLSVTFTFTNGIFEGVIKVTSAAENFVARATDQTVCALGDTLAGVLMTQLDRWKALRFNS